MQFRDGLLGGVFVGDAPAREFARVAEFLLQIDAIDADDDAVDAVRQLAALGGEVFDNCQTASIVSHFFGERIGGDAPGGEGGEKLAVRGERIAGDLAAAVGDDAAAGARPRSRESSCLSVPAVALRGLANGSSPAATTARVQPLELGRRHVDFAADFDDARESDTSCCRWSASGIARIVRTFCVTSSPRWPSPRVAASTSWPSLVAKIDGDAVHFGIGDVAAGDRESRRDRLPRSAASYCLAKFAASLFGLRAALAGRFQFGRRLRAAWDRWPRTRGRPICGGRPRRTCCRSRTSAARGRPCESLRSARRRRAAWGCRA